MAVPKTNVNVNNTNPNKERIVKRMYYLLNITQKKILGWSEDPEKMKDKKTDILLKGTTDKLIIAHNLTDLRSEHV